MSRDEENGNKGRNPWGSGGSSSGGGKGKNPWGSGNGGGGDNNGGNRGPYGGGRGPEGPDLDDILARMQDGMKGFLPGDFGGGKAIMLGVGALALLWLASGFYTITPGEHAVVQRFGAWHKTIDTEGLNYRLPAPIESMRKFNVNEIRTMNIGFVSAAGRTGSALRDVPDESLMLTSDFNIVDLDFVVQWNISSAEDFIFNIENPENTLRKAAQSAIREVVGQTRMFSIITTERGTVADRAKNIMQTILNDYKSGINITQVLINSAEVHPDVQSAFQDVQSAKQDAEDVQNRAQAYREDIIPRARGAATRVVQEAEAYRESVIARATGDADRFNAVLGAYQSGQDVTKQRMYIETMEAVLQNAQKVIIDNNGKQGVVPYLPLSELTRSGAEPKSPAANTSNKAAQ